jgi:uncharacterized membrane protein YhaH (DUF805 family)
MIESAVNKPVFFSKFWKSLEFYSLFPRLNRVKFYALLSFWFGILFMLSPLFLSDNKAIQSLCVILIIGILPNFIAIKIRRLHDIGLSAWWLLVLLIPYVGFAIGFFISFWPGENKTNKYGEKPQRTSNFYGLFFLVLIIGILVSSVPYYQKLARENSTQQIEQI